MSQPKYLWLSTNVYGYSLSVYGYPKVFKCHPFVIYLPLYKIVYCDPLKVYDVLPNVHSSPQVLMAIP